MEDKPKEEEKKEEPQVRFLIPDCCREGWASCEHVVKPFRKPKGNIGL